VILRADNMKLKAKVDMARSPVLHYYFLPSMDMFLREFKK